MAASFLSEFLRRLRGLTGSPGVRDWTDARLRERFAPYQDEAAFEALVKRHGPMVLGVCRQLQGAVAVVRQDTQGAVAIRRDQVEVAVVGQIPRHDHRNIPSIRE